MNQKPSDDPSDPDGILGRIIREGPEPVPVNRGRAPDEPEPHGAAPADPLPRYCVTCGAQVLVSTARFCVRCGTPAGARVPSPSAPAGNSTPEPCLPPKGSPKVTKRVFLLIGIAVPVAIFIAFLAQQDQHPQRTASLTTPKSAPKTVSLDDAKRLIPALLRSVYQALNQGNPQAVSSSVYSKVLNDVSKLDYICKPFSYRAHYIDGVVERPIGEFQVRVRLLSKPINETYYILYFVGGTDAHVYLADVSRAGDAAEKEWFSSERAVAAEMARKFLYAAKGHRADVVSSLVTKNLDGYSPRLFARSHEGCYEVPYSSGSDPPVKIFDTYERWDRGLKIMVDCSMGRRWYVWVDTVDHEHKIVAWNCTDIDQKEDPDLEEYTLKRFGLLPSGETQ